MSSIKALEYKSESKGKLFKSWEISHIWLLQIEKTTHKIEYLTFKWSKNRKIFSDSVEIFSSVKDSSNFSFTFYSSSHLFTVTESSNSVQLYIDGLNFSVLYKRQAGSFVEFDDREERCEFPFILKKTSDFSKSGRDLQDWEAKAKNFRLVPREISLDFIREKVDIRPHLHRTASSTFAEAPASAVISPRATITGSDCQLALSVNVKMKKRQKKKPINFFLF
jgi:hypothetical protein